MTTTREVTTWYLEMTSPSELRPAPMPEASHRIERVARPSAAFARHLYCAVGGDWHWTDRLTWSKARWDRYLARDEVWLHALVVEGEPVGYLELERQADGNVELAYFGLTPQLTGRGFGGWLLTRAVELAWQMPGTRRVWVHSCSLDAAAALPNYQARGFRIYRTETKLADVGVTPGPWPGWDRDDGL
jgi:GNAT superfamily N-acetyltransferase